jgi:pimeloyl-ACP methyl ester carboxylesterase
VGPVEDVDDVVTTRRGDGMDTAITNGAPTAAREHGAYIDIDGIPTYYEVRGNGDPVVLLHGGLATAETFDLQTNALAEHYRVYVPERFGHGRTRDIDGAITYENMAQHTIAFIERVGIASAHVAGWSDGALVALLVALRRPSIVRKLVLIDQYVSLDGAPPAYLPFISALTVETAPPELAALYGALSPDGPEHLAVVMDKLHAIWTGPTGVEVADLARVTAPALVLASDHGASTIEHLAAVARALAGSQLAVVPGTSHGLAMEKPEVVNRLLLDFFADEQVTPLFPLPED